MRIRWLVAGWALGSAARRLSRRTGVTDAEAFGTLPGDEIIPHPMAEWTRGVTVRAAPERIWPWLVQMGYGRAGWYTPAWVDRVIEPSLFQLKSRSPRSPDQLLPEASSRQDRKHFGESGRLCSGSGLVKARPPRLRAAPGTDRDTCPEMREP
jgi:hypothetical protein